MALNSDSRVKNASRNALSAVLNKFCILLLTFIGRKFFIQYIGVEYLGINGLFSNILMLLSMADLGLGTAMNVSLYKPIASGDEKKLCALINYFRKIYIIIAVAVTIIGVSLIPFLDYIVNLDSDIPYLKLYYLVFVLKNTVSYLFVYKASMISADQKNYVVNRVDVGINIFKVVAQIVVVLAFKNYLIYILVELFSVVAHNIFVSVIADRLYPFLNQNYALSTNEKKSIFSDVYSAFLYKLSGSLLTGTDNILISVIVGTIAVGLYSNYFTIINNLEMIVMLIFTSLTASVGNLVATANPDRRYKIYSIMQMVANWLGAVFAVALFFLLQPFIVLWIGKDMLMDQIVLWAIIIRVYYAVCMRPVWTFREGTGMYRQIRYVMVATTVVNFILSVILGKLYSVGGILLATTISRFVTCYWVEPKLLFETFFEVKVINYHKDYALNIAITVFAGFLCSVVIGYLNIDDFLTWIMAGMICCLIVSFIYFIRYHRSNEFQEILQKVKGMIIKK